MITMLKEPNKVKRFICQASESQYVFEQLDEGLAPPCGLIDRARTSFSDSPSSRSLSTEDDEDVSRSLYGMRRYHLMSF